MAMAVTGVALLYIVALLGQGRNIPEENIFHEYDNDCECSEWGGPSHICGGRSSCSRSVNVIDLIRYTIATSQLGTQCNNAAMPFYHVLL